MPTPRHPQQPTTAPGSYGLITTWYVGFTSFRGHGWWFRRFVRPGFGHVFACAQLGDRVLVVEPVSGGVSVGWLANPLRADGCYPVELAALGFAQHPDMTMLRVTTKPRPPRPHPANLVPSCVTVVKALLGTVGWSLTPRQLYRQLLAEGAQALPPASWPGLAAASQARLKVWASDRQGL